MDEIEFILKLADFGSVEELNENNVFRVEYDRLLPIRWAAYEAYTTSMHLIIYRYQMKYL